MTTESAVNSITTQARICPPASDPASDLAVETLYRFLAAVLSAPDWGGWPLALDPENQKLATDAAELLRSEYGDAVIDPGFGELPVDQLTVEPLVVELKRGLAAWRDEFARVFGLGMCRDCPPYETEYHADADTFFRSQQMADVAGFYRAFGLASEARSRERPDHLALELEFAAFLIMKERCALGDERARADSAAGEEPAKICRQGRATFLADHLSWWGPSFARAVRRKAAGGIYAAAAGVLAALLPIERFRLGVSPPQLPRVASPSAEPDSCEGCIVELKT